MSPANISLPQNHKIAYALPAFALAVVGLPVYMYIPKFYTDVVGVDIVIVGYLLLGVRVFDAVTDPLMGWWSDAATSAMGRRRPFILFGAVLLAGAIVFLFVPPVNAPVQLKTLWFAAGILGVFLFWTVTTVPYEALGPALSRDYNDRIAVFAWRDGLLIAGTLAAVAAPAVIRWIGGLEDGSMDDARTFAIMAALYAPMLVLTCVWCVYRVSEPRSASGVRRFSFSENLRLIHRNRPFMILVSAFAVSALASNLPAALILYYVQYVLLSSHAHLFLLAFFITGIAFLPLWRWIAGHIGKREAWLVSLGINAATSLGVFFLGPGDGWIFAILVVLAGTGFGASLALPSALQADVIDYDELISGERREGHYMGMWSVAKKFTAAAGVGLGLAALGLAGYVPNQVQTETVRWVMRIFYALVPAICYLTAMLIAFQYPLSRDRHRRVIAAIDRRTAGDTAVDPLKPGRGVCRHGGLCTT